MSGEIFNLQTILIKDQRSVDIAQRAGQINVGNSAMIDAHMALRNGPGKGTRQREVNGNHAGGSEIWIEGLNQFQVNPALGSHIKITFSGQLDSACR